MTKSIFKHMLATSVGIGAIAVAGTASAQPAADDDGPVLEEIIVTGDRPDSFGADYVQAGSFRGARQIDTPLTVSVIPQELLESQQAVQLQDALRNTPGVTSSQTSPTVYNNLSIRGIPVENRGNYRLNGSLPIVNLIDLPLENKARVEALKGASALYYGFTSPSGIINLTTKRPPRDPVLVVTGQANDFGGWQGHIDAGGTTGILGVRGNLVYGEIESGIERTTGHRSFQAGAIQLDPTDNIQINLDVEHINKTITEPTVLRGRQAAPLTTVLPQLIDPRTNPGSEGFLNRATATNVLGRVEWKVTPAWAVVAEAGLSDVERNRRFSSLNNFDPVTGNGTLSFSSANGQLYENKNGRLEIAGTFATGPLIHELLLGASKNVRRQFSPVATTLSNAANCVLLGLPANCVQNAYNPIPLANIQFTAPAPYDPARDTNIHDTGFYAFDRVRFGGPDDDLISLLLGVRKTLYKETVETSQTPTFEDKPLSFSVGAVVKPMPWISVYGTFIEGLETTAPPPQQATNFGQVLPASESQQYEAGIKIEPWRGLLITGAYFDIQRELTYLRPDLLFVKDGRASYKGVELSAAGEITPNLSVYASALFLDAKQGETNDLSLIGKRIENTAETQWSIFAEYRFTDFLEGLAVNGGAFHTGDRAINPQNSLIIPGYTLFDLGGSYTFFMGEREIVARVNAQNITGKRYFGSSSSNFIAYGTPPTVKFSLSAKLF